MQSVKFVESHQGKSRDIALYGQELTATTYKLAKMNLAIRGLSANLGERPADTFFSDQHPDLKADYILANPPFNLKDWRNEAELTKDPRFAGIVCRQPVTPTTAGFCICSPSCRLTAQQVLCWQTVR